MQRALQKIVSGTECSAPQLLFVGNTLYIQYHLISESLQLLCLDNAVHPPNLLVFVAALCGQ